MLKASCIGPATSEQVGITNELGEKLLKIPNGEIILLQGSAN